MQFVFSWQINFLLLGFLSTFRILCLYLLLKFISTRHLSFNYYFVKFDTVEPNIVQPPTPCDPNPCGTNAQCKTQNGAIDCSCPGNYVGDPFSSCRPECVLNTDCPRDKSCSRNRCVDPCAGACGDNADCRVANHIPVCSCKEAHTGDPYGSCRPIPVKSKNSNDIILRFEKENSCFLLTHI